MRIVLAIAMLLMLAVALASASLRLAQAGVGCSPWPACQSERARLGEAQAATAGDAAPWQSGVRLTHRISASLAGLLFVWIVAFGWSAWSASERIAGATLLVVAALLAWLGRVTPSPLPAVALANMLGGFVLLAALLWLLWPRGAPGSQRTAGASPWPVAGLITLLLVQITLGAMVSARAAAGACLQDCGWGLPLQPWSLAALDPWAGNVSPALAASWDASRQAVLQLHSWGGAVLLAVALAVIVDPRLRPLATASALAVLALLALLALTAGLGLWMRSAATPLAAAVAHSLLAGLALLAALVALRRRTG